MYVALLHDADRGSADTSTLRAVRLRRRGAAGARCCTASRRPSAAAVLEGYGLSETSPVASFNQPDRTRKPGSIGTPIEGVEMRLVDADGTEVPQGEVGEIAIRGHNVMKGYWQPPGGDGGRAITGRLVPHRRHGHAATRTASTSSSTARRT